MKYCLILIACTHILYLHEINYIKNGLFSNNFNTSKYGQPLELLWWNIYYEI